MTYVIFLIVSSYCVNRGITCDNGYCVSDKDVCDEIEDCSDGKDEEGCCTLTFNLYEYSIAHMEHYTCTCSFKVLRILHVCVLLQRTLTTSF